ncbi:MAG: hypothetical protein KIS78_20445 [Labilithrix sp.]|nr:hypothetical protein [Labilithrix sp.]MCW5834786.1 hypothetical protein [Labilithrix sp.]
MVEVQSAANDDGDRESVVASLRFPAVDGVDDGPTSVPTVLVEVDAHALPTVLPAPPKLPTALDGWRSVPAWLPRLRSLSLVTDAAHDSQRPTVRAPAHRSGKLLRIVRRSTPPTVPPPGSAPMRRAA